VYCNREKLKAFLHYWLTNIFWGIESAPTFTTYFGKYYLGVINYVLSTESHSLTAFDERHLERQTTMPFELGKP